MPSNKYQHSTRYSRYPSSADSESVSEPERSSQSRRHNFHRQKDRSPPRRRISPSQNHRSARHCSPSSFPDSSHRRSSHSSRRASHQAQNKTSRRSETGHERTATPVLSQHFNLDWGFGTKILPVKKMVLFVTAVIITAAEFFPVLEKADEAWDTHKTREEARRHTSEINRRKERDEQERHHHSRAVNIQDERASRQRSYNDRWKEYLENRRLAEERRVPVHVLEYDPKRRR